MNEYWGCTSPWIRERNRSDEDLNSKSLSGNAPPSQTVDLKETTELYVEKDVSTEEDVWWFLEQM